MFPLLYRIPLSSSPSSIYVHFPFPYGGAASAAGGGGAASAPDGGGGAAAAAGAAAGAGIFPIASAEEENFY